MKKILFMLSFLIGSVYAQLLAQTADLKCVYTKGEIYVTKIQSLQVAEAMGMEIPQEMVIEAEMEVLDVTQTGDATMKMTYSRVKFEQDNPMAGLGSYDSNLKEQPQDELSQMLMQMFSGLVDKSLTFKINNRGEFLEIMDGDPVLKASFESQSNAFHFYPNKPLKIGESWNGTQRQGAGENSIIIENTYTLKGKVDNYWLVDVVSVLKNENDEKIGNSKGELKIQETNAFISINTMAQNIEKMKSNGIDVSVASDNITTISKK